MRQDFKLSEITYAIIVRTRKMANNFLNWYKKLIMFLIITVSHQKIENKLSHILS